MKPWRLLRPQTPATVSDEAMVDVLTPEQRRLNMSRIRSRNTKPEMALRRGLHSRGFRFRLHCRNLPGCPDLVFPRYRTAILVHGCFWHGHDCSHFKLPTTRPEFWSAKIASNRRRDARTLKDLAAVGWRALVVWECALKGTGRRPLEDVLTTCERFLRGDGLTDYFECRGSLHGSRDDC